MDFKYELIKPNDNLPVKIIIHKDRTRKIAPRHWHENIELSYVLSGEIDKIYIDGVEYTSRPGDIVLINSNAIHSFFAEEIKEVHALTILIPYEFLKTIYKNIDQVTFDCISNGEMDEERIKKYNELRKILNLVVMNFSDNENDPLGYIKITGLIYELIYFLLKNFKENKKGIGDIQTKKYHERLNKITGYIKENYNKDLSINKIASYFGLSPEYLSRTFIKYIGMTILNYINFIRLEKSYRDLMNTDHTIMQIAMEHGFPNEKSFIKVFKDNYGITPSQYRKENKVSYV